MGSGARLCRNVGELPDEHYDDMSCPVGRKLRTKATLTLPSTSAHPVVNRTVFPARGRPHGALLQRPIPHDYASAREVAAPALGRVEDARRMSTSLVPGLKAPLMAINDVFQDLQRELHTGFHYLQNSPLNVTDHVMKKHILKIGGRATGNHRNHVYRGDLFQHLLPPRPASTHV